MRAAADTGRDALDERRVRGKELRRIGGRCLNESVYTSNFCEGPLEKVCGPSVLKRLKAEERQQRESSFLPAPIHLTRRDEVPTTIDE
jgi:hypothetical protein